MTSLSEYLKESQFHYSTNLEETNTSINEIMNYLVHLANLGEVNCRQAEEYLILAIKLELIVKHVNKMPNSINFIMLLEDTWNNNNKLKQCTLFRHFQAKQRPLHWTAHQLMLQTNGENYLKIIQKYYLQFANKEDFLQMVLQFKDNLIRQQTVQQYVEQNATESEYWLTFCLIQELANIENMEKKIQLIDRILRFQLPMLTMQHILISISSDIRKQCPDEAYLVLNSFIYYLQNFEQEYCLKFLQRILAIYEEPNLVELFYKLIRNEIVYDAFEKFTLSFINLYKQARVLVAERWCIVNDPLIKYSLFKYITFDRFLLFMHLFMRQVSPVKHRFKQNVYSLDRLGNIYYELELIFKNLD